MKRWLAASSLLTRSFALLFAANRAFANLKCENYGSAIADADEALRLDPEFIKANYRKGAALSEELRLLNVSLLGHAAFSLSCSGA